MQFVRPRREYFLAMILAIIAACLGLLLAGCGAGSAAETPTSAAIPAAPSLTMPPIPITATATASPAGATPTVNPIAGASPTASPDPSPTAVSADAWQDLPVIPTRLSERAREIYKKGLAMGNQAHVFSRIGDCASAAPDFLVGFAGEYNLGAYQSLQATIDYFDGSFGRSSLAAKAGLNSAGLLTTLWTGPECKKNESLLDCQYRLDNPSFAFISIGTNEAYYVHRDPGVFEENMRKILDDTIARGILPILATKADNIEGDNSINATIARLALEYQVPLWNFWAAAQPLPDNGLADPDHLSSVSFKNFTDFSLPNAMEYGMQVHNLTALEMLQFLRENLADIPPAGAGSLPGAGSTAGAGPIPTRTPGALKSTGQASPTAGAGPTP